MRRISGKRTLGLFLVSLSAALCLQAPTASASRASLGTITGAVLDNKGNPVSGALISLLRDGASKVIKQTRSDAAGRFSTRISPGRYGIRAIAEGFNAVVFSSVEVRASQELVYRFNLEPIGSGKTLPERRRDRDDVKWTLRSAQTRRSIFQAQEGEDRDIQAVLGIEAAPGTDACEIGTQASVVNSDNSEGIPKKTLSDVCGELSKHTLPATLIVRVTRVLTLQFQLPPPNGVDLILAGQTGVGPNAPGRFEASTHVRAGQRHRLGVNLGAVSFGPPIWATVRDNHRIRHPPRFAGAGNPDGPVFCPGDR